MKSLFEKLLPLLIKISPEQMRDYFERNEWRLDASDRGEISIYSRPIGTGTDRIIVYAPNSKDIQDYEFVIYRAAEVVSRFQKRNPMDVISQFQGSIDIFSTTVPSEDAQYSSIPLAKCLEIVSRIRDLVIYSAAVEMQPSHFFKKKLDRAIKIADTCLYGQTDLGSFVSTFYLPLPKHSDTEELFDVPTITTAPPIERRVTERIWHGLKSVSDAVEQGDYRIILDNAESGLNANMCNELSGLLEQSAEGINRFQIEFDPAWPKRIEFSRSEFLLSVRAQPILARAAEEMMETPAIRDVEARGVIYELRVEGQGNNRTNRIKFVWQQDKSFFTVQSFLPNEDYQVACDAHKNQMMIQVEGTLEKIGRVWSLVNPHNFKVIGDA